MDEKIKYNRKGYKKMLNKFGNTDSYNSEPWILRMFEGWFDPCPYDDNPNINGLNIEWGKKTYVNPPYSKPLPWVEKAITESNKGKIVVMLLRVDTSTRWWAKIVESKAQILWINGRLRYRKNSYNKFNNTPVPWASMLIVFNGDLK